MNTDFYIGWMAKAPRSLVRFLWKYVIAMLLLAVLLAGALSLSQKKFRSGNFEFGTLTEVTGVFSTAPVPNIRVVSGKDSWGNSEIISIPLIGYGKFGADGAIADFEKKNHIKLENRQLAVKGTLLYDDGKVLMQIDESDSPFERIGPENQPGQNFLPTKKRGTLTVKGEIVDPKCFFGVMKPGEGKVHKDCAIRCILGGMPPVLKVTDAEGRQNYYLLVGSAGEKINEAVKDFIAEPVEVTARAEEYGDWVVLYMDKVNGIKRYSYLREHFGNQLAMCAEGCKR